MPQRRAWGTVVSPTLQRLPPRSRPSLVLFADKPSDPAPEPVPTGARVSNKILTALLPRETLATLLPRFERRRGGAEE